MPAPVSPTSPATATPPASVNTAGLQPETQIAEYYQAINNRNYQSAWQMLPPDLQSNPTVHPQGYSSFTQWWESIASVDVVKIRTTRQDADRALVNVRAIYRMKNGQSSPFILRYMMAWDATNQKWSIARISR